MADVSTIPDPVDLESPAFGGRYILGMVLLAAATIALHALFVVFLLSDWTMGWFASPFPSAGVPSQLPQITVVPSSTVVWRDEVWSAVVTGAPPPQPFSSVGGAPSSRLVAFSTVTGKPRLTNITIPRPLLGLVVVNDELLCVCSNVIYQIKDGQALPRHPNRSLSASSRPFVYQGRLAVVETNSTLNGSTLLIWSDGEWINEDPDDTPRIVFASNLPTDDVRVVSDEKSLMLFTSGGNSRIWLQNGDQPDWKPFPMALDWQMTWEVARFGDAVWAFGHSAVSASPLVNQYKFQNGVWTLMPTVFPPQVRSFGIASGPAPYLVSDDWHLFSWTGSSFQRVTAGIPMTERFRSVFMVLARFVGYLLANGILALGTTVLMRRYRRPQYLYGKRTVIQAPVLRRAAARGIDLMVTVFPPAFWMAVFLNDEMRDQLRQQSYITPADSTIALVLLSLFGMWIGLLLVLSVMEGLWGYTPGKWLMRICTLRTTLRPCGVLRAFSRELLLYADCLFFMTWLPGVLLIAFTPHWQRLGDLASDTVVVLDPKRTESGTPVFNT